MTAYEMVLLARAVEACDRELRIEVGVSDDYDGWYAGTLSYEGDRNGWTKPTLADALAALLRDLGVEVPEPPSAERVAEAEIDTAVEDAHGDPFYSLSDIRDLYAREPQTVLALLEGGAS